MKRNSIVTHEPKSGWAQVIPRLGPNSHPPNRWGLACLCVALVTALLTSPACAQNQPPVANAGGDQTMYTGDCLTV